MTELEVKENRFYVLRIREGSVDSTTLHSEIGSSVERVREALKNGMSPESIELMSFDVKEEKFEIKGVPWSTIAAELVKQS